jgi:hypothetical protein
MTSNLVQRIWQHKQKSVEGFTERNDVALLVYFVELAAAEAAITKETAQEMESGLGICGSLKSKIQHGAICTTLSLSDSGFPPSRE